MFLKSYTTSKCINQCEIFNDENFIVYWEERNPTNDEIDILNFLNKMDNKNIRILHVGVGSSYIAKNLKNFKHIDGITISSNEVYYANKLNINNYKCYFLNKHKNDAFSDNLYGDYDFIIDVNLKSFSCCQQSFDYMFLNYTKILNKNGQILSGKKGMNWTSSLKPVLRFSFKKFFYKKLKEYPGKKNNILTIDECLKLSKKFSLNFVEEKSSNIVRFIKF